jgi:hypothetical protein
MHKRVMAEAFRRRGAADQVEVRRLRAGVFRLGGYLGLDTRAVVRFSETISGKRWKRCSPADLERVAADFAQVARRVVSMRQWTETDPAPGDKRGGPLDDARDNQSEIGARSVNPRSSSSRWSRHAPMLP